MSYSYKNLSKETAVSLLEEKDFKITKLQSELDQLKRMIFGSKSERFVPVQPLNQSSLELEIEPLPQEPTVKEQITYERKKAGVTPNAHVGRTPIPNHIERRTEIIEPTEDITGLKKIGEEVTEILEYQAPQFYVRKIVRPKYSRPEKQGVVIAQLPSLPIEKGIAGSSLLSWIIIEKFVYHLPLHRLIQKFAREGQNTSGNDL